MNPFTLHTEHRHLVSIPGLAPFIVWGSSRAIAHTRAQAWLGIYIPAICVSPYCTTDILSA